MADPKFEGDEGFDALTDLLTAMGVSLPYDKMRQSMNVVEAIPGTTGTTRPIARRMFVTGPDNPLAIAAGVEDVGNPFMGLPMRKVERRYGRRTD